MPASSAFNSPSPASFGDDRYVVLESLGAGGMAAVYRVLDRADGVEKALKVLLPATARSAKTRARFYAEATTMSRLDHPNIVRILDVTPEESEESWFVMELCPGGSLAARLKQQGPLPPVAVLFWLLDALRGLEHAHATGVVHRDVKPHNMLLSAEGRVKMTDFGIARVLSADPSSRITGTGDTLGTLAYMAPEQRVDPRKAGTAADLYGVGATLYLLATGRRPFDLAMIMLDPTVLDRLPAPLRPIVRRATAQRASDRYPSARSMAAALVDALQQLDRGAVPPELRSEFASSLD
jgi:serine/threonine-protein kinase